MGPKLLALCLFLSSGVFCQTSRYVSELPVPLPGLISIFEHPNTNVRQKHSLIVASYSTDRSSYDSTYAFQYPGEQFAANFSGYGPKNMFNFLFWPKEVRQVPRSVLGHDAVVHLDGSTIFGKTAGSVYLTNLRDFLFPATYDIGVGVLPIPSTFMYHTGLWKRVDNDNRVDFMGCRVEIEAGMVKFAQLYWLAQPRDGITGTWGPPEVLKESACDTNMAETPLAIGANTYDVVYATGLHLRRLTFFYTSSGTINRWDNPNNIAAVLLDSGREFFDVTTVDLNKDGRADLLVTVVSQTGGSVEVYQIPSDFRNVNQYVKRVIADGFVSRNGGASGRTPGIARPFYPTSNTAGKPWIMVSGADDGRAYYLRPTSTATTSWDYEKVTVADHGVNQVVWGMASADIDGDGFTELFVSVRGRNKVETYTFRP